MSVNRAQRALCERALAAARSAYAPYSGYAVGAAVRTVSGRVYTGANMENASYGLAICAEVSALAAANAARDREIVAIAVVGFRFHPAHHGEAVCTPCGRCRQLIGEFADLGGHDIAVYCCNGDLTHIEARTIGDLLPDRFGPRDLGLAERWAEMERALTGGRAE